MIPPPSLRTFAFLLIIGFAGGVLLVLEKKIPQLSLEITVLIWLFVTSYLSYVFRAALAKAKDEAMKMKHKTGNSFKLHR